MLILQSHICSQHRTLYMYEEKLLSILWIHYINEIVISVTEKYSLLTRVFSKRTNKKEHYLNGKSFTINI